MENDEDIKDFIAEGNFKKLLNRMNIGDIIKFSNKNRHYTITRDK